MKTRCRFQTALYLTLLISLTGLPVAGAVFDDFESYAVGSNLHGQDGWSGWAGDAGAGALVSTDFAFSPTRAVKVTGDTDLVRAISGATNGSWLLKVMQYIPSTSSGTNYVVLLNRYQPPFGLTDLNWSVQFQNNMNTGQIVSDLGGGATLPMVKNQWVELRVEVNLAANTVSEYYNGQLLSTHTWQDGSGLNQLQALDLFADGSGPVYYDNVSLSPAVTPGTLLKLSVTGPSSANEFTAHAILEWSGEPGKTYLIQSTDDLASTNGWQDVDVVTCKSSDPCRWDSGGCRQARFFRLVLPQPQIYSVEPSFVNSADPTALLYVTGQGLPTNGSVVINGLNFTPSQVDSNGGWIAISLNGLPPGTPIIGSILVLDSGSNIVTTLPLQNPVLYGAEMAAEQLQGPPDEPPASPAALLAIWASKKGYDHYRASSDLNAAGAQNNPYFSNNEMAGEMPIAARKGYQYYMAQSDLASTALVSWTKGSGASVGKPNPGKRLAGGDEDEDADEDGDGFDGALRKEFKGHVTLLKRGDAGGSAMGKKHTKTGHVTLLKRGDASSGARAGGITGGVVAGIVVACVSSGEVQSEETDLAIPGRGLDFAWTRSYRSRADATTAQGAGWDFSFNVSATPQPDGTVILHPGNGRADTLYPNGTNGWTRDEYFLYVRDADQDGFPDEVVFPDGGKWLLHPPGTDFAGKLAQIVDRNNNAIRCEYDGPTGRLLRVVDTLDRTNTVAYNSKGFIESVTDFSGRTVRYEYDSAGDLTACISPAVTGTPTGNDFPGGKTNRYAYTTGNADQRLNHNLVSITDPKGQLCLAITYQATNDPASLDFDAVSSVQRGIDKKDIRRGMVIARPSNSFATVQAIVNDYVGNVTEYLCDSRQRCVSEREYTGRANPALPTTATENRPTGKLRADDPDYFETRWEWNADSLCTLVISPDGSRTEVVYQEALNQNSSRSNNTRKHDGDVRVIREVACCDTDDDGDGITDELRWTLEHDPRFGSPAAPGAAIRHRGWDGTIKGRPPEVGARHKGWDGTIKGRPPQAGDQTRGRAPAGVTHEYHRFATSVTDPRGNVTTASYDANGNVARIVTPFTSVTDSTNPLDGWKLNFAHNTNGQVIAVTNASGVDGFRRVDTFSYYTNGSQAGQLQSVVIDDRNLLGLRLTTSFEYDPRGNVTRVVDPRGNDWLFAYNALDQLVRAQTPVNLAARRQTDLIYDANGNVQDAIDELRDETDAFVRNVVTHWDFDSLDRCVAQAEQVSPGVFVTNKFAYDGNGQMISLQSPLAVSGGVPHAAVQFEYDERGLVFREIGAPGSGNSPTNEYSYNLNGMRTRINELESKLQNIGLLAYDGFSRLASYTDPMGNVTTFNYDRNGNCTLIRFFGETNDVPGSAGNRLLGSRTKVTDAMNRCIQTTDLFFNPATGAAIGDGAATTTYAYAPNGDCTTVTDDNGRITRWAYDTVGRVASITDPKTNIVSYNYDECGNVVGITHTDRSDLTGTTQQFTVTRAFNKLHRLMRTVDNVGNTNRYDYDSLGRLVRQTDPKGNVSWSVYDDLGRLTRSIGDLNGDGIPELAVDADKSWAYDANSRCVAATDDNTNTTYYVFNWMDCIVSVTSPDGTGCSLIWSPRSNLIQETDPNGTVITNTYDLNDRLVHRDIAARVAAGVAPTTTFETFAYDGLSQLVAATNDASACTFAYDSLGNCIREVSGGAGALVNTYDGARNRLSSTYPAGRLVTFAYDALDQVASVGSGAGGLPPTTLVTCEYEGPGRAGRISRANNVNTRIQWDGTVNPANAPDDFGWGQVRAVNHQVAGGGTTIDRRLYAFDRNQNKILRAQTVPFVQNQPMSTNNWNYDSLDRLAQGTLFRGNSIASKSYVLDGNDNRQLVLSNGVAEPYIMDATPFPGPADFQMNQYTITPLGMQTYDDNGNLIGRASAAGQLQYQYDYANRLVAVYDLSGGLPLAQVVYAYDALGRRVGKTVYPPVPLLPVTTAFVYDDTDIIEQYENGALQFAAIWPHMHQTASHLRISAAGSVLYAQGDDVGNVLALTDAAGQAVERYDYDDFGFPRFFNSDGFLLATNASPAGNPFLLQGMQWEAETGFYFGHSQGSNVGIPSYYDSQLGRSVAGGMPNRISMNTTVPKQTQGATFGEMVNAGLHAAGSALAQGRSSGFGSGGAGGSKVQDHNSSRSNKSSSSMATGDGGGGGGGAFGKVPRTVLKTFFQTGDKPTQAQFSAMIDSMLSVADDRGLGGGGANPQGRCVCGCGRAYHKSGHVTVLK